MINWVTATASAAFSRMRSARTAEQIDAKSRQLLTVAAIVSPSRAKTAEKLIPMLGGGKAKNNKRKKQ